MRKVDVHLLAGCEVDAQGEATTILGLTVSEGVAEVWLRCMLPRPAKL